ncbi:MAG: family 43 glycosylhydrolase [Treponema sp.]|nr:family 43 glycosylhydrolase [Treponema sp.]
MKKQAFNPFLPSYEYIPDGEPYVFDNRVYVYGSHDCFNGTEYCMNDYVCWSAPVDDPGNWRYEGLIYKKDQDPGNRDGKRCLFAPDLQKGPDGRYYLYYAVNGLSVMSVAVCDSPAGRYEYYGAVHYPDGGVIGELPGDSREFCQFDPGVLVDDDGRVYLYSGIAPRKPPAGQDDSRGRYHKGAYLMELEQDMLTVKRGPELIFRRAGEAGGSGFEGHEFFEASSLRKVQGKYYFIYSSINGHELCYAVSGRPDGGFCYGGVIISNGDIFLKGRRAEDALYYTGNNHGSIVEIQGQWYVFYHRQTNLHQFSRQACAEPISFRADGSIPQVEMTSSGLNGGALAGHGEYEARIACNLYLPGDLMFYPHNRRLLPEGRPYMTQDGGDREDGPNQHIANFRQGAVAGFKYFQIQDAASITITVRGDAKGLVQVSALPEGKAAANLCIAPQGRDWQEFSAPIALETGKTALYFSFRGSGSFDFLKFRLE